MVVSHLGSSPAGWRGGFALAAPAVPLLIVDAVLIALFLGSRILTAFDVLDVVWRPFDLGDERSIASLFLDLKWALAALALFIAGTRLDRRAAILIGVVMTLLLADDALELHERIGGEFVHRFGLVPAVGLRAQDFGELIVVGILLALVGTLSLAAWILADAPMRRWIGILFGLLAALGICGVGFDMAHIAWTGPGWWGGVLDLGFALAEDGGELAIGSLILVHSLRLARDLPDVRRGVPIPLRAM